VTGQDGTLTLTRSGAKFATGADDWKFFNGSVCDVVKAFHADGYKIVIFTYVCSALDTLCIALPEVDPRQGARLHARKSRALITIVRPKCR